MELQTTGNTGRNGEVSRGGEMGRLANHLKKMDSTAGAAAVKQLIEWTSKDPVLSSAQTLATVVASRTRAAKQIDPGRMTGTELCGQLEAVHKTCLQQFRDDEALEIDADTFTHFRNGELQPRAKVVPLAFLIWLADSTQKPRVFGEDSLITRQLAVFNPLPPIENFVLNGVPLPHLRKGTPSTPLTGAMDIPTPSQGQRPADDAILETERLVGQGFIRLLGVETLSPEILLNDLFETEAKEAHFLVYRRSVQPGQVIKGFLSVQTPREEGGVAFSFTYFYRDRAQGIFRETRGFVLSLGNSHFFVGGTGKAVPEEKFVRGGKRSRPKPAQALKCIVVGRSLGALNDHVWGGLFLSNGPSLDPIAGRCVLVRARHDNYQNSNIDRLPLNGLAEDLRSSAAASLTSGARASVEGLASGIARAIDNSLEPVDGNVEGPLRIVAPLQ